MAIPLARDQPQILQQHVACELGRPAGRLLMIIKSAHVYETERNYVLAC